MTTELVPKTITPSEVFVPGGLDPILVGVRARVKEFKKTPLDMEKKKDRDNLRSFSSDIAKSKVFVDKKRKLYVEDKTAELKTINGECKSFRDTMDEIKDDTRKPLTEWEDAEKVRVQKERELEIYLIEWDDAIAENNLFDRETIMCAKEAEVAKQEEEKRQKKEEALAKKEQALREERLKKEAVEKTKKEAKEKAEKILDDAATARQKILIDINVKLSFESCRDMEESVWVEFFEKRNNEYQSEQNRKHIEKMKADNQAAIQKAKDDAKEEAQRKEQQRLDRKKADAAKLKKEKEIADRKAANLNHQKAVNRRIISAFTMLGISEKDGRKIIRAIVRKELPDIFIKY